MKLFSRSSKMQQPGRRSSRKVPGLADVNYERENTTFRRNRTLTGSVSSRIASVGETNADMKSARVHAHELTQKRRHLGALFLGVLIIALVLFGLISQFTAKVVVKADGVVALDES